MPIMLALCSMLLHTYYAKNYAGIYIIDSGLMTRSKTLTVLLEFIIHLNALLEYIPLRK